MPANRPTQILITHVNLDTHSEVITLSPAPEGLTAIALTVEGFTPIVGVIELVGGNAKCTFSFAGVLASAGPGPYPYKVKATAGGETRTVVEGTVTFTKQVVP